MKRVWNILLILMLLLTVTMGSAIASNPAVPTSASVLVNGQSVTFEAYNIADNNYFKLRDLAQALKGSDKQFEVGWDASINAISLTTGQEYTTVGGELASSGSIGVQSAVLSSSAVYINGIKVSLTAYNIAGYNYFKLRDVASAIKFGVGWDGVTNTITIDTTVGYTDTSDLTVHFLDVGQGDSEFIILPDSKTMLIDAGESEYGDTIVNYIRNLGYSKIDYLVATHPHADHIGGMTKIIQNFKIGSIYMPYATTTTQTYADLLMVIKNAGLTISTAKAGVTMFNSNGVTANIIAPVETGYDDLNNYSAVIKLIYNNNSVLFMGDAEELSENEITANVKADILKVGHHGSDSSTGQTFLNKIAPKYAVISVGADNDYGHPVQTTLDKLSKVGAAIYRTDKDGTIIFTLDGTNITVNKTPSTESSNADPSAGPGSGTPAANVAISGVDKVAELVTIENNGLSDVNLAGWVLISVTGNQRFTFPSYILKAGAKITVASGGAYGDLVWSTSNIWNNSSSDPAQLYDSTGTLISTHSD